MPNVSGLPATSNECGLVRSYPAMAETAAEAATAEAAEEGDVAVFFFILSSSAEQLPQQTPTLRRCTYSKYREAQSLLFSLVNKKHCTLLHLH